MVLLVTFLAGALVAVLTGAAFFAGAACLGGGGVAVVFFVIGCLDAIADFAFAGALALGRDMVLRFSIAITSFVTEASKVWIRAINSAIAFRLLFFDMG